MLAGAERHARSDDPEPGPYPEPRDGERAVIHDAIPAGDLAMRRSVMVGAPVPRQLPSFHGALVNRTFRSHPDLDPYHQTIWEDTQIRNTNV